MGETDVSVMLLYPVFHKSSSLTDANFAAFAGNSVSSAVSFSRVGRSFWPYWRDFRVVSDFKTTCFVRSGEIARTSLRRKVKPRP